MPFDLNIEKQRQRQIIRNKYTSREFNIECYSIFTKDQEEFFPVIDLTDEMTIYQRLACDCDVKEKPKKSSGKRGKPVIFPKKSDNLGHKTFIIKYERQLSISTILLLNSFRYKYFYFAMDDIINLLKSNPIEQNNILSILYLPAILLHNNFSISFFHMWIEGIYINKVKKPNKFLLKDFKIINYISIKFMYKIPKPIKKKKSIW